MSSLFSCFSRKPKKPIPTVPACLKYHTSELSALTSRPEEADYEQFSQCRPRPGRTVNRPLGEYQFPRVESTLERQASTST